MYKIASKSFPYSPMRYPGGKGCLASYISNVLTENSLFDHIYVEPYAGGAGSALTLLIEEKVDRIVINDFDRAIFSFWKSILDEGDRFIRKLERIDLSVDEWKRQKSIYKSRTDAFSLGFSTFYLNRTNRSGIIDGGLIGGVKQESKWGIDARFNREGLIDRIKKIMLYKKRIKVSNEDGIALVNKMSRQKDVFFYLDPPYYVQGSSLYLNHYKHNDHLALSKILNRNYRSKWILTYDNVSEIKALYPKRKSFDFTLNYSADSPKQGQEIFVFSDVLKIPNLQID